MPLCHLLVHSGDVSQRLFLALWPPPCVVSEIAAVLPTDLSELRWQPPARWHITMAFLGERGTDKELRRPRHVVGPEPGPLSVAGAGSFGPVLWLGIAGGDWLGELARRCAVLFDADDRRFRAHLTVARARSSAGHRQLAAAKDRLGGFHSSPWLPDELTLVGSHTGPRPSYEVIGRRPLPMP